MSATKEVANTMRVAHDPWADCPLSLAAKLAQFFSRRPNTWIDGRTLATIAGAYAWRTRISDLRRAPFSMVIANRQRYVDVGGQPITLSEYRFVVQEMRAEEAADGALTPSAAV
jgi:hypothetical protein